MRVKVADGAAKTAELDGARLPSPESLRREFTAIVFTPDRLAVVKGGPAARRAYFDRALGRLQPARAGLPQDYARGARAAQRGAAPRAARAVDARRARAVDGARRRRRRAARRRAAARRSRRSRRASPSAAGELGLPDATLGYAGEPPTAAALEARLEADLRRGSTGLGPHLDDVRIASGERDLRSFGSQGEQRLALLALLLAETECSPVRRCCCSTTCSRSSTRAAAACSRIASPGWSRS